MRLLRTWQTPYQARLTKSLRIVKVKNVMFAQKSVEYEDQDSDNEYNELWLSYFRITARQESAILELAEDLYNAIMKVLNDEGYLEKILKRQSGGAERDYGSDTSSEV